MRKCIILKKYITVRGMKDVLAEQHGIKNQTEQFMKIDKFFYTLKRKNMYVS